MAAMAVLGDDEQPEPIPATEPKPAKSDREPVKKLGGKAMDGLYATMTVQNPYLDEASQPIRFWANKYKTKYNDDPTVFSIYGYNAIDAFIRIGHELGVI